MKMHLIAFALVAGIASISLVPDANAAEEGAALPSVDWSFSGPFGTFDRAQLQRGYKVYKEVCANCHSMSRTMEMLEDVKLEERPAHLGELLKSHPAVLSEEDEKLVIAMLSQPG